MTFKRKSQINKKQNTIPTKKYQYEITTYHMPLKTIFPE